MRRSAPQYQDDKLAAAIGHITILEEKVDTLTDALEQARQSDERQENRIRFIEERFTQLARPRTLLIEQEAAEMLRVHIRTLKRWRNERPARIPFITFEGGDVRYRTEDIERYLNSRTRGAKTALRAA
jgi:hypothetical protein